MRSKCNVEMPSDLAERARNLVSASPGLTLTMLFERGLRLAVEREEKRRGGAAPERKRRRLPAGRKRTDGS